MASDQEPMLEALAAFVSVVEQRGFSAAARKLGLQKTTISRRVQALEQHLGGKLLHRTTRELRMTEVGTRFYERAAFIVREAREAEAAVRATRGELSGTLRVSMPLMLAEMLADSMIVGFTAGHPRLVVELDLASRLVEPVRDGYDVVIRAGEVADSALRAKRLPESQMVLIATREYTARAGKPQHPRELAAHDAIVASAGASLEWPLYGPAGPIRASARVRLRTPSFTIALAAVDAHLGIAAFPRFFLGDRLGHYVSLLTEWTRRAPPMFALYAGTAAPAARAFVALLSAPMKAAAAPTDPAPRRSSPVGAPST
jgi:DNA-binding transcriptional LysR family regulator